MNKVNLVIRQNPLFIPLPDSLDKQYFKVKETSKQGYLFPIQT